MQRSIRELFISALAAAEPEKTQDLEHATDRESLSDFVCLQNEPKQESCAIAKMTAQCALHMGALKIFGTP